MGTSQGMCFTEKMLREVSRIWRHGNSSRPITITAASFMQWGAICLTSWECLGTPVELKWWDGIKKHRRQTPTYQGMYINFIKLLSSLCTDFARLHNLLKIISVANTKLDLYNSSLYVPSPVLGMDLRASTRQASTLPRALPRLMSTLFSCVT